jgi:hypothetical protein
MATPTAPTPMKANPEPNPMSAAPVTDSPQVRRIVAAERRRAVPTPTTVATRAYEATAHRRERARSNARAVVIGRPSIVAAASE